MAGPWLSVQRGRGGTTLKENKQALSVLSAADTTVGPALVVLVGRSVKSELLQYLISGVDKTRFCSGHGHVHLWQNHPNNIVWVDYELHSRNPKSWEATLNIGPVQTRMVDWASSGLNPWTRRRIANILCAHAIAPISNILVYFASDLGGARSVARLLAEQAMERPAFTPFEGRIPYTLVVFETVSQEFDEAAAREALVQHACSVLQNVMQSVSEQDAQQRMDLHFRKIDVLGLRVDAGKRERSNTFHHRITELNEKIGHFRREYKLLFSPFHLQEFAGLLLDHVCTNHAQAFSFIHASRPTGFSMDTFPAHVEDLLCHLASDDSFWRIAVPLLASTLILASYPPRAHLFPPRTLFKVLYQNICREVLSAHAKSSISIPDVLMQIETKFDFLFHELTSVSASELHIRQLQQLRSDLTPIKSHRSCLCCMVRTPEKVLDCGHALCNTCVVIFGRRSPREKYTFFLPQCVICGLPNVSAGIQIMPPTAGVRILSVDGGGVRGVIPLVFLQDLDKRLATLGCPFVDYFDFVCGTSAGGLIILGLFLMRWTTSECLHNFEELASKTFRKDRRGSIVFSRLQELAWSYWHDCQYRSDAIENAFKSELGSQIKMFNPLQNDTKVAVTTTTARESFPCIFSNYNGGIRSKDTGYSIIRAKRANDDVSLSDAASSTSAAPWFFKPKSIKHLGTFQDGGLHHNNPVNLALWEAKSVWPDRGQPDFVLSLGTGTWASSSSLYAVSPRSPVKERFISRVFHTFMKSLDGEKAWTELRNGLPADSGTRYHRLNLHLKGKEPSIDDIGAMTRLKHEASDFLLSDGRLNFIADSLHATLFYFELEAYPMYRKGAYNCVGNIFCRLQLSRHGREALQEELCKSKAHFIVLGHPVPCTKRKEQNAPFFKRYVRFSVPDLEDIISISITGSTSRSRSISGMPKSLRELLVSQKLQSSFGRTDHVEFEKPLPQVPAKRKFSDVEYVDGYI